MSRMGKSWSCERELSVSSLHAPVEWNYDEKYNLVSMFASEMSGRSLVLNGHLDVVPAEPSDTWSRAPHIAWEQDGWLYGRGAGDMQSGVAAMIYAVHAIRHAGYQLNSPVTIQCVVEEECSGNGTLACLERGFGGDFVLIPEPLGPQLHAAQVGVLWFRLAIRGTPVHVLRTSSGSNAIEKLWRFVPALKTLEESLNLEGRSAPYDQLEHPFNFNIGKIKGGDWPSCVAWSPQGARLLL
jgi:acetylornithine deacetylase